MVFFGLRGLYAVAVGSESGVLTVDVGGAGGSWQWDCCNPATPDVPVAIDGATTSTYTPSENGIYFVDATGGNLGYNYHAVANPAAYTTDGVLSMVANPTITMHSNAITITEF